MLEIGPGHDIQFVTETHLEIEFKIFGDKELLDKLHSCLYYALPMIMNGRNYRVSELEYAHQNEPQFINVKAVKKGMKS